MQTVSLAVQRKSRVGPTGLQHPHFLPSPFCHAAPLCLGVQNSSPTRRDTWLAGPGTMDTHDEWRSRLADGSKSSVVYQGGTGTGYACSRTE
jgi:hypothetical protein